MDDIVIYFPHEFGAYKLIQICCNGGLYHFTACGGLFQTSPGKTLNELENMFTNRVHLASNLKNLSYDNKIKYCDSVLFAVKK